MNLAHSNHRAPPKVGTSRCDVPGRVQRPERMWQPRDGLKGSDPAFPRGDIRAAIATQAQGRRRHRSAMSLPRLVMAMILLLCARAVAQPISDAALARIDFAQNLNAQVPLDLQFVDETGKSVRLGQYFGSKPVILVLGYYGSPMLCTLVLNGLVESLQDMNWRAGEDFAVVNVSI